MNRVSLALTILFMKGGSFNMAVVYATLIIRGARTFDQVPSTLKDQVRQVLIDLEMSHLAE